MIQEAYCSFEVAKLLKEKGFNESCYTYYDDIDTSINRFDKGYHFNNTSYPWGVPYDVSKAKKYIVTPTHQMVMKWLREAYKLEVRSTYDYDKDSWWGNINPMFEETDENTNAYQKALRFDYQGKTYEEAVEAALKYALENLI